MKNDYKNSSNANKNSLKVILINFICKIVILIPKRLRLPLCHGLSKLAWTFDKRSQKISFKNLDLVFPDKSVHWKQIMAKRSYFNAVCSGLDVLWLNDTQSIIHNKHVLDTVYKEGKGVCLLTLHLGSWENLPSTLSQHNYPVMLLTNVPKDFNYLAQCYNNSGISFISKHEPNMFFELMKYAKEGKIICFFTDQYSEEVPVNFLGIDTTAPSGGINLACMMNMNIVIGWTWKDEKNRNHVNFENFYLEKKPNRTDEIKHNIQRVINRFEALIKAYPEQWLWCYNRFKNIKEKARKQ